MKFKVTMKYPDALYEAITDAVTAEVKAIPDLDEDERESVIEARREKVSEICRKWFEYGEYLFVEIDTEVKTATVLAAQQRIKPIMKRKTAERINRSFYDAWDEFGDDKSTEFLLAIVADRENVEYETVVDALSYCNQHGIKAEQKA